MQAIATFCLAIGLSMYYEWRLGLVTASFTPIILIAIYFERRNTSGQNDSRDQALQNSTKVSMLIRYHNNELRTTQKKIIKFTY